ncbi:hypothetical protein CWS52_28295, partial [Klebsiella michiganensis]|nr:hypothetical protein [Klebsiella michiganensis]
TEFPPVVQKDKVILFFQVKSYGYYKSFLFYKPFHTYFPRVQNWYVSCLLNSDFYLTGTM